MVNLAYLRKQKSQLLEGLTPSQLSSIYISCMDLPLDRFIMIHSYGEPVAWLDKSYDPDKEDHHLEVPHDRLEQIWGDIQLEYSALSDGGKLARTLSMTYKISALRIKFQLSKYCLYALGMTYDPDLASILRSYGYDLPLNPDEKEEYHANLRAMEVMTLECQAEIQMLEGELMEPARNAQAKKDPDPGVTWIKSFLVLEEDAHFKVKPEEMTVAEYIERGKMYVQNAARKALLAKKGGFPYGRA